MASVFDTIRPPRGGAHALPVDPYRLAASPAVAVAIVALAVVQQALGHLNGDVSWFVTFAEKVLGGARAYVDVSDPNPPAAFIVYMPAVLGAHLTGFRAEALVVIELLVFTAASLGLSMRILRPGLEQHPGDFGLFRNAALWILLVVPGFGFAEREHLALLAVLPLLAVFAMRAEGRHVSVAYAVLAGLGSGVALAFKPHYGIAIGFAALAVVLSRRSLAMLFRAEIVAVAGAAALYGLFVWLWFPAYVTNVLPVAIDVYSQARQSLRSVMMTPLFVANAGLLVVVAVAAKRFRADARVAVLCAASAGFLVTFVIQSKAWFNHAYPGLALVELAAVVLWLNRRTTSDSEARFARLCVIPALLCAPFFSAPTMTLPGAEEHPGLTAAVRANAPARPRIAALAEQLDFGHPLVRELGGTWIGRQNALWISNCVNRILASRSPDEATRAKLDAYARRDREDFAADVAKGRPDVLIVENRALRIWAGEQKELASLFESYRHVADADEIEIWVRAAAVTSAGVADGAVRPAASDAILRPEPALPTKRD